MIKFNNSIEIIEYNKINTECICVLGCLKTKLGIKILKELLSWVPIKYHTYIVYQDPPGKLFEYPALKFAKDIAILSNKPVLYLHTKGAANNNPIQPLVRKSWKFLFYDNYQLAINSIQNNNTVYCLMTGEKNKVTWYNGFIANVDAWKNAKIIQSNNRFFYEHYIWINTNSKVVSYIKKNFETCVGVNEQLKEFIRCKKL